MSNFSRFTAGDGAGQGISSSGGDCSLPDWAKKHNERAAMLLAAPGPERKGGKGRMGYGGGGGADMGPSKASSNLSFDFRCVWSFICRQIHLAQVVKLMT